MIPPKTMENLLTILEYGTSDPTNLREWWTDYSNFSFDALVIKNTKPPTASITLYLRILDIIQRNRTIISNCGVDIIMLSLKNPIKSMIHQTHTMSNNRKDVLTMMLNDPNISKDLIQSLLKYNTSITNLKQYVLEFKKTLHNKELQLFHKSLQNPEIIDLTSSEVSPEIVLLDRSPVVDINSLISSFNTSLIFQLEHPVLNSILLSEERNYINLILFYYNNYQEDLFDTTTYTTLQEISRMIEINVNLLTKTTTFEYLENNTDLLNFITNQHISSPTKTYNGPAGLLDSIEPLKDFVYKYNSDISIWDQKSISNS